MARYYHQAMLEAVDTLLEDITYLQRLRRKGYEETARDVANGIGIINDVATLSKEQIQSYMQIWRLWIRLDLSLARQMSELEPAVLLYKNAQHAIQTYYDHPEVQEAALEMPNMAAEMQRDRGAYFLQVAQLTGNRIFLNRAVGAFTRAVELSEKGSSTEGLAIIERNATRRKVGRQEAAFQEYQMAFRQVLESPLNDEERKTKASLLYTKESLISGHPFAAMHGIIQFISHTRQPKEISKHLFQGIRNNVNVMLQRRRFHSDPQSFALS